MMLAVVKTSARVGALYNSVINASSVVDFAGPAAENDVVSDMASKEKTVIEPQKLGHKLCHEETQEDK